jgi:hypothetical protein
VVDPDSLVMDGSVYAAASKYPVVATLDSAGLSPTRFYMVQVPGTQENPEWAACVWKSDPLGGDPILMICEKVKKIGRFETSVMVLVLEGGQMLTITPDGGCGCGTRLKSWQPWGPGVRVYAVPQPTAG